MHKGVIFCNDCGKPSIEECRRNQGVCDSCYPEYMNSKDDRVLVRLFSVTDKKYEGYHDVYLTINSFHHHEGMYKNKRTIQFPECRDVGFEILGASVYYKDEIIATGELDVKITSKEQIIVPTFSQNRLGIDILSFQKALNGERRNDKNEQTKEVSQVGRVK